MVKRVFASAIIVAATVLAGPSASQAPAPATATPVTFDWATATELYLSAIGSSARASSSAYFEGAYALDIAGGALMIIAALLIVMIGAARGIRDFAEGVAGSRAFQAFIAAFVFLSLVAIALMPFAHFRFLHEGAFGHANQTPDEWLRDYAVACAIAVVLLSVFTGLVYPVMQRMRRLWFIWGGVVATAIAAFVMAAGPFLIAPLFNTYEPMEDGPLKDQILELARNNGVNLDEVYRFDASEQDTRLRAEIGGLLGVARASISDTFLDKGTGAEIRHVMAREVGHRVLGHDREFLILFATAAVAILFVSALLLWPFASASGLASQADLASMPILFALVTLLSFGALPLFNTLSRQQEASADEFALNTAREPDALATLALKLSDYRKVDMATWEEAYLSPHRSARSTISRAMFWKEQHLNELPVPGFEVEVGCSRSERRTPVAEVRWYADYRDAPGPNQAPILVDVAVTKTGFADQRYLTIRPGALVEFIKSESLPRLTPSPLGFDESQVTLAVGPRPDLGRAAPIMATLTVKDLESGVFYFWRLSRAGVPFSRVIRTEVGSCPADFEEDDE